MNAFQISKFGKYTLLNKIATGGMAEVYRAKISGEEGFEKLIVIKKILPYLNTNKEIVNHFIDEAKLDAMLQHENIINVYDFGNLEGSYFIAMEYLFGKDLDSVLKKSLQNNTPLSLESILYITSIMSG